MKGQNNNQLSEKEILGSFKFCQFIYNIKKYFFVLPYKQILLQLPNSSGFFCPFLSSNT